MNLDFLMLLILINQTFQQSLNPATTQCIYQVISNQHITNCAQMSIVQQNKLAYQLTQCHYTQNGRDFPNCSNNDVQCGDNLSDSQWLIYTMFTSHIIVQCNYYQILLNIIDATTQLETLQSTIDYSAEQLTYIQDQISQQIDIVNSQFMQTESIMLHSHNQLDAQISRHQFMENMQSYFNKINEEQSKNQSEMEKRILMLLQIIEQVSMPDSADQTYQGRVCYYISLILIIIWYSSNIYLIQCRVQLICISIATFIIEQIIQIHYIRDIGCILMLIYAIQTIVTFQDRSYIIHTRISSISNRLDKIINSIYIGQSL